MTQIIIKFPNLPVFTKLKQNGSYSVKEINLNIL